MNGEMIGKRTVRTNWASRKAQQKETTKISGSILSDEEKINDNIEEHQKQLYERVYNSTDSENCTVYLGNLGTPEQPRLITGNFYGIFFFIKNSVIFV